MPGRTSNQSITRKASTSVSVAQRRESVQKTDEGFTDRDPSPADPSKIFGGPNLWPSEPASFKPNIESWIKKNLVIGSALMEATALGLGMDLEGEEWKQMEEMTAESFWVMRSVFSFSPFAPSLILQCHRCIGYPSLPADAPGVSCGAHKGPF